MSDNKDPDNTIPKNNLSTQPEKSNQWPGLGRLWFALVFIMLAFLVSLLPDWAELANKLIKSNLFGYEFYKKISVNNKVVSIIHFVVQLLLWNFMLAAITAPVFYLRIINIRLSNIWIMALIIPFVWAVLLVRCLVYQSGYTNSGKLDEEGKMALKWITYSIFLASALAVTYLLADYF